MTDAQGPARRLAFVVPEWTTTEDDPGDQALVTERICVALLDAGWAPEVFAPADEPGTVDEDGITVHRVARGHAPPGMPAAQWVEQVVDKSILAAGLRKAMNNDALLASTRMRDRRELLSAEAQARLLGAAVEARQQEAPFQAAISTATSFVGLHVPPRRSRPHIVRVTGWPHEWAALDEDVSSARRRRVAAEVKVLEDAQGLYASCAVVAEKVGDSLGKVIPVIPPPAPLAPHTGQRVKEAPRRYLLMCGPLDRRHGAETLAAALPHAWRIAPEMKVVLAGAVDPDRLADWQATWGEAADQVTHLDDPGGGELVALAARAVALVVPALADDLSEMAQQGLAVGVPVIATRGSGTAELVTPGETGAVVPTGSPAKLGEALAAAWSGRWGVGERVTWTGPAREAMDPDVAARALGEFVARVRDEWAEPAPQG